MWNSSIQTTDDCKVSYCADSAAQLAVLQQQLTGFKQLPSDSIPTATPSITAPNQLLQLKKPVPTGMEDNLASQSTSALNGSLLHPNTASPVLSSTSVTADRDILQDLQPITLRVGEELFSTSLRVLKSIPNSFFSSLFSKSWQTLKQPDGSVPLLLPSRPGLFRHVFRYLVTGTVPLTQLSTQEVEELRQEAEKYYFLPGLSKLLSAPLHDMFSLTDRHPQAVISPDRTRMARGTDDWAYIWALGENR